MKLVKISLMALAIFAMAFSGKAEVLQSSGSSLVKIVGGKGVWQFEPVSYTGQVQGVSITAISGSAATSYFDKLTTTVASIYSLFQSATSTSAPLYTIDNPPTQEFYWNISTTTALTATATPIYLTNSASSSVFFDNTYGAVTVNIRFTTANTVPPDFTTQPGYSIIPGAQLSIPKGTIPITSHWMWWRNPGSVTVTAISKQ